jgi:hypothetical protein
MLKAKNEIAGTASAHHNAFDCGELAWLARGCTSFSLPDTVRIATPTVQDNKKLLDTRIQFQLES